MLRLKRNSIHKTILASTLKRQKKMLDSLSKENENLKRIKDCVSKIFSKKQLNY